MMPTITIIMAMVVATAMTMTMLMSVFLVKPKVRRKRRENMLCTKSLRVTAGTGTVPRCGPRGGAGNGHAPPFVQEVLLTQHREAIDTVEAELQVQSSFVSRSTLSAGASNGSSSSRVRPHEGSV